VARAHEAVAAARRPRVRLEYAAVSFSRHAIRHRFWTKDSAIPSDLNLYPSRSRLPAPFFAGRHRYTTQESIPTRRMAPDKPPRRAGSGWIPRNPRTRKSWPPAQRVALGMVLAGKTRFHEIITQSPSALVLARNFHNVGLHVSIIRLDFSRSSHIACVSSARLAPTWFTRPFVSATEAATKISLVREGPPGQQIFHAAQTETRSGNPKFGFQLARSQPRPHAIPGSSQWPVYRIPPARPVTVVMERSTPRMSVPLRIATVPARHPPDILPAGSLLKRQCAASPPTQWLHVFRRSGSLIITRPIGPSTAVQPMVRLYRDSNGIVYPEFPSPGPGTRAARAGSSRSQTWASTSWIVRGSVVTRIRAPEAMGRTTYSQYSPR
jgi:hypothetical protein